MIVADHLRGALRLAAPLAVACFIFLYFYPIINGCAFPIESRNPREAAELTRQLHWPWAGLTKKGEAPEPLPTKLAPFRLLALGDPQLEGDTSVPVSYLGVFPHIKSIFEHVTFQSFQWTFRDRVRAVIHDSVDIWLEDVPFLFESVRKFIDLYFNDFYLAHIYRTVHWWTRPTHVTVLGDLIGSQWIEDDEFERRGARFWNRTFSGGERVPNDVAQYPVTPYNVTGYLNGSEAEEVWSRRIINVAGNHDIGYAGDLTEERLERFERVFGKVNYELRFELPITDTEVNATVYDPVKNPNSKRLIPQLRILVLNDMNLDTPVKSVPLQDQTYQFINTAITTAHDVDMEGHFTLVLTHIPIYKPAGVCWDYPFFEFFPPEEGGGIREQYLLSYDASKGFLEGLFGMSGDTNAAGNGRGRHGAVLNGHDHEGCDTFHYINQTNGTSWPDRSWEVKRWVDARDGGLPSRPGHPGRREITVRSMMGGYGGNAGLYSMWFDQDKWEWQYEYAECPLGTQHFWWFTHILAFGVVLTIPLLIAVTLLEGLGYDVDGVLERGVQRVISWYETAMDMRVQVKVYRKSSLEQPKKEDNEIEEDDEDKEAKEKDTVEKGTKVKETKEKDIKEKVIKEKDNKGKKEGKGKGKKNE